MVLPPIDSEAFGAADAVISALQKAGRPDYTAARKEIATLFHEVLWNGNWDAVIDNLPDSLPDLRFVQEDEYDQHMDDDPDRPDQNKAVFVKGHYVFPA